MCTICVIERYEKPKLGVRVCGGRNKSFNEVEFIRPDA